MLVGIILSILRIQDSIINRDAIVYISTAETFIEQGFYGIYKDYNWLPYAVLGALLSKISSLSLETSFYIINTSLYSIIPVIFISLSAKVAKSHSVLPWAGLLILTLPSFNHYRDMIIRDVGFWCFSLLALLAIIQYVQTRRKFYLLYWQLAVGVALLFRIEAIVWILGLPFSIFLIEKHSIRQKFKDWFYSVALYLFIVLMGLVYLLMYGIPWEKISLAEKVLTDGLNTLKTINENFALHSLNEYSSEHAGLILTSGLLIYFGLIVLTSCSPLHLVLAAIAIRQRYKINLSTENKIIIFALIFNLLTLLFFLIFYQFMIERYAILSALLTLLLISQPISAWVIGWWPSAKSLTKISILVLVLVTWASILISKNPPQTNLKSAGTWIQNNITIDTPIAVSDNRLLHYSDRIRKGITCVIEKDFYLSLNSIDKLGPYSYLVVHTKKEHIQDVTSRILQETDFIKLEEFSRGGSVTIIFKNPHPDSSLAYDCNPFR